MILHLIGILWLFLGWWLVVGAAIWIVLDVLRGEWQ